MKHFVYAVFKHAFLFILPAIVLLSTGCEEKVELGTLKAIIKSVNLVEITGAVVYIDGTICGTTSENGLATITKLDPGPHTIMILAVGYDTYVGNVIIVPGEQTETFLLTVHTGTLTGNIMGRVLNAETGLPVAGATVNVEGIPALQTTTDAQGKYRIDNVPSGYQEIVASKPDFIDGSTTAWIHDNFDNPVNVTIYP